ncbi:MAG: cell division protein SepF [Clostridia bacterium]|nr:cell division protein SepF [Clostridia bacterium]
MKVMDFFYKILGFETEDMQFTNKKTVNNKLGEYNIKKINDMPDKIDGVPVYYPETLREAKELLKILQQGKPFFINLMFSKPAEKGKIIDFFEGATSVLKATIKPMKDNKLYAILPEGVNIEEIN